MLVTPLDPQAPAPLHRQLYEQIREGILAGRLSSGTPLPATRALAEELGISRNTVLTAYAQLLSEGYLEGHHGSGTYVTQALPDGLLQTGRLAGAPAANRGGRPRLSRRGRLLARTHIMVPREVRADGPPLLSFRPGVPEVDPFISRAWLQAARRFDRLPKSLLGYGSFAGHGPLREEVATYLREARGVRCESAQVLIVNGSQQALDLSARVLLDAGDEALLEDPGYLGVRGALLGAGARLRPLPVDREGIVIARANRFPRARLLYVTPSYQYPLGVTMSLPRRLELLEWARRTGGWILEDDYDSQYRYAGHPLPALQGLDRGEHVLYIGTFSKVMFPALRLGYLVVPPSLVGPLSQARALIDHQAPILEQVVLAQFMAEGLLNRHIRRMRTLYRHRQAHLLQELAAQLGDVLEVSPAEAGMHLLAWLPQGWQDKAVSTHLAGAGIEALALSHFSLRRLRRGGLLLGYPALSEEKLSEGVRRMAQALQAFSPRGTGPAPRAGTGRAPA